jgi:hypothetical protein
MDLQTAAFALEIAAPDARRWTVDVPKTAPDGYEIRLDRGAARYRGVLIAAATGKPLANVRVHAEPRGKHEDAPSVSGVTDAEGRFEITGLAALPYELFFHSDPEVPRWYDYGSAFKSASFLPEAAASPEPAWLEIRLGATSGTVRLTGRVVRQATGAAVEGAMLRFECSTPATGGTLRLGGDHSIVHTDANGRFELVLPRTRSHEVNVYVPGQNSSALTESFEVFDAAEAPPLEFAVP